MLNPGDYRLPKPPSYSNDTFTYYGYFIAGDKEETENISIFNEVHNIMEQSSEDMHEEEMKLIQDNIYKMDNKGCDKF